MLVKDIPTPALFLDKNILEKNMLVMTEILKNGKAALRPHYKSHKCASLAHMQISAGAIGMTCAKLSEAEDLVDSGIVDILIANQIVAPEKIARLAHLAGKCKLKVLADCKENIKALGEAASFAGSKIGILVEYEIGMKRCGVRTKEELLELAKYISSFKSLSFDGIQAYAGHLSHEISAAEREARTAENHKRILDACEYLSKNGIEVKTISGGSTGTAAIKVKAGLYTELQAGSYLFMDATYKHLGLPFENSLFLLTTAVSVKNDLVVVDGGVKTCGVDQGMPAVKDFEVSRVVDSEEHFQLHDPSKVISAGDKVTLIPAHCCSTVNLHDKIYLVDGDRVVDRILVTARGIGK